MKKLGTTCVMLFLAITLLAQKNKDKTELAQNGIKINASSLLFGHLALQYERVLSDHFTVCMGLRVRPKLQFGGSEIFEEANTDPNNTVRYERFRYGSIAITPEFRYYPKQAMRGIYLAPYFRYRNTPFDMSFSYVNSFGQIQTDEFRGHLNALMGGLMIGTNIYLSPKMSLDIFIFGGHYSSQKFGLSWTAIPPLTAYDQQQFSESFAEIEEDLPGTTKFDYTVNSSGFDVDARFGSVGFRGAGANLVYKF